MKNLKLFVLSICFITSIGIYNTFGEEKDIYISDIDLSNINMGMKTININGKSFKVTSEDIMKYRVLRFFYKNDIQQTVQDYNTILEELQSDLKIAQENNDINNSNLISIFAEIRDYVFEKSGLLNRQSNLEYNTLEPTENNSSASFYGQSFHKLRIDGKDFNVRKNIVNKYPILHNFINTKNPFPEWYDFYYCMSMAEELEGNINKFKENGTVVEADSMRDVFLAIRSAIEKAVRVLAMNTNDKTLVHEMNIYIRDILSTDIIEKISFAYNIASQRN